MELLTLHAEESIESFCLEVPEEEIGSRRNLAAEQSREIPRKLPGEELPVVGSLAGKDRCSNSCQTEALKRGKREAHS